MPVYQTTQRWITQEDGSKIRGHVPADDAPSAAATPRTHADADELAASLGIEFPEDVSTVKEKQEFLAANAPADDAA